jgi:hypothetical protein
MIRDGVRQEGYTPGMVAYPEDLLGYIGKRAGSIK